MKLEQYSNDELRNLKEAIGRELEQRKKQDLKDARSEMKAVAERYGFSIGDLVPSATPGRRSKSKGPVRFQHPEDASKTWAGRGRKPQWVKDWEASGGSLEDLRAREAA